MYYFATQHTMSAYPKSLEFYQIPAIFGEFITIFSVNTKNFMN